MTTSYVIIMIAIAATVTMLLRFIPFIVFRGRKTPAWISYLGNVLPYAIMGMLVVFCLKGTDIANAPHGIPELISCAVVVGLHIWKRNTLLSIVSGTICYMLLVQLVFI